MRPVYFGLFPEKKDADPRAAGPETEAHFQLCVLPEEELSPTKLPK